MDHATDQFYSSGALDLFFFSFFLYPASSSKIFFKLTNRSCNKSLMSRAFCLQFFPTQLTTKVPRYHSKQRSHLTGFLPLPPSSHYLGARSLGDTATLISSARASSHWLSSHSNVAICPICQLCRRRRCLTAEVLKRFLMHMQLFYALLIRVAISSPYIAPPAKQKCSTGYQPAE